MANGSAAGMPRRYALFAIRRFATATLPLGAAADHVIVEAVLGDLPPEVFLVPEGLQAFVHLLEVGVLRRNLVVEFVRGLEPRVHDLLAEGAKLRARGDEPAERCRV